MTIPPGVDNVPEGAALSQTMGIPGRKQSSASKMFAELTVVRPSSGLNMDSAKFSNKEKVSADQKQLQLKSDEAKILNLDSKLNACKTNREYQTLREQIAAFRMATKVLEDEILEALERIDAVKKTLPAAESEVASIKKQLADTRSQIAGETATLEAEVARISGDLICAEGELPADSLESYRRVAKSKGADSLASVEGESCGGCFQQITGNMVAELKMGKIIACRSCGRLLYLAK